MATYVSDIVIGTKYRDKQTGFEGVAVVISFHQFACERVILEAASKDGDDIKFWEFDAERLEAVGAVKKQPEPAKTGATATPGLKRAGRHS